MGIINECLELDPASKSWLRWKRRPREHFKTDRKYAEWNARHAGTDAGCIAFKGMGYFLVGINKIKYRAHRIVFALATGIDSGSMSLDHIDGDGTNNNPENLRLVTHKENGWNRGASRSNSSGKKGVYWDKQSKKWRAQITICSNRKKLGLFNSIDDAAAAYDRAAREHHGEFYRPS